MEVELSFHQSKRFITVKAETLAEAVAKAGRKLGVKGPTLSSVVLHSTRDGIGVYSATLGPNEPELFDSKTLVTFQKKPG